MAWNEYISYLPEQCLPAGRALDHSRLRAFVLLLSCVLLNVMALYLKARLWQKQALLLVRRKHILASAGQYVVACHCPRLHIIIYIGVSHSFFWWFPVWSCRLFGLYVWWVLSIKSAWPSLSFKYVQCRSVVVGPLHLCRFLCTDTIHQNVWLICLCLYKCRPAWLKMRYNCYANT